MSSAIQPVIEVAILDKKILNLKRHLKQLEKSITEERTKVDLLQNQIRNRQSELEAIETAARIAAMRFRLEEAHIHKFEEQIPLIRNQKEFIASKKQLEDSRKLRSQTEEDVLQQDIVKETSQQQLAELQAQFDEATSRFQATAAPKLKELKKGQKEQLELEKQHLELLKKLDPKLHKFHQNCGTRGIILPICEVVNQSCTGCHLKIPPQVQNELIAMPDRYAHCPHCARAIYYVELPKE